MIDFIFFVRFLAGFFVSISAFFLVIFLIRAMRIHDHGQRSNLYLLALLSSFSIALFSFFFFDIRKRGDSLVLMLPNQVRGLEVMLRMSLKGVSEGPGIFDFRLILLILFFTSLVAFLSLLFISRFYIQRKYNLMPCRDERVHRLLKTICGATRARHPEPMTFRGDVNAFVFGFPPVLAISEELLRNVDVRELRLILKHEMNHIQHHDHILKPFLFSLKILFFYNPCVHALNHRITREREFLADRVSDEKKERVEFLSTLVRLSELRGTRKSLSPSFISSPLVRSNLAMRTETLLSEDRKSRNNPYLIFFWLFSILLFTGTYASGAIPSLEKQWVVGKNDVSRPHPADRFLLHTLLPRDEFNHLVPNGFHPHQPIYEMESITILKERLSDASSEFPLPPKCVKGISPPQFYIIKIRKIFMAFLFLPIVSLFFYPLAHSVFKKKDS